MALYRSSLFITKKYPELGLAQFDLPERAKADGDWQIASRFENHSSLATVSSDEIATTPRLLLAVQSTFQIKHDSKPGYFVIWKER